MNDPLTQTLALAEVLLWHQYLAAEAQGQRKLMLSTLGAFVEALQEAPEERRHHFAETFCRQMADAGEMLPLREPLFAGIIGPYLVSAHQNGERESGALAGLFSPALPEHATGGGSARAFFLVADRPAK